MTLRWLRNIAFVPVAGFLMAGPIFGAPPANSTTSYGEQGWDFVREASDLLREVDILSGKLVVDAATLESFSRSKVSWQSHAGQVTLVKGHINEMGRELARLQAIQHVTAPWQQEAINRIVPVAVDLAARTQAAIEHLNQNRTVLIVAGQYGEHLAAIADRAAEMKDSVSTFLEYANTQQKMERLERELELDRS